MLGNWDLRGPDIESQSLRTARELLSVKEIPA